MLKFRLSKLNVKMSTLVSLVLTFMSRVMSYSVDFGFYNLGAWQFASELTVFTGIPFKSRPGTVTLKTPGGVVAKTGVLTAILKAFVNI